MAILIISIALLGLITALVALYGNKNNRQNDNDSITVAQTCDTCDGSDTSKCEQECMMEAAVKDIEYFDDEELDAFRHRHSDSYTDEEAEMFAEVVYTMRADEVAAWCRSLNLRGIELPDQIKDEVMMLMNDAPGQ